jgi:hypothetical protein
LFFFFVLLFSSVRLADSRWDPNPNLNWKIVFFFSFRLADSRRESTCAADARWNLYLKQIPDGIHI